ncbi:MULTISPECIES: rod shape-determining protein MreC [unclassified Butyrivibrio]|uniref:rod shape-determining protein MreC n=1 Tax=unclassified Butyrivibrio TaxID=2639466 RepID=UPI00041A5D5A|nr:MULTISPECIES: rod shape-determining protein MreC [unclassified Butyrivibrio]SDB30522.1 rod shape-determining protein MreC [Butyrivibrio sp. INlla16]SEK36023.1 rod shape-determining protein MreC [Butyrivibrio sp. ob235]
MSPIIKRGGDKFTLPSKYLLFILTILCVGLIIITFNTNVFNRSVNSFAGTAVIPFQKGITTVGVWMKSTADNLESIRALQKENQDLKSQIEQLTIENTHLEQDKYELIKLRELYELDAQYSDYKKIGARIIAKDAGNWYHSFVIDKGSDVGVEVDMNVIAGGGLVGRVTDVGPDWAKVQTIIADNSSVSCTVLSASENLIATGDLELYNEGQIAFSKLVDEADKVSVGDKVVTSNISDKYLPGVLVGYISTIEEDSNNLTKSGKITPVVQFEYMNEVLVVMELKNTGE